MNVLFLSSRGEHASSLMIEREITLLQQRTVAAAGEDVTFHFLPDVSIEALPLELSRHQPDILHISAHGTKKGIVFANSSGDEVLLSPQNFLDLLHPEYPPRLLYLNGCDSHALAKYMTKRIAMAIGITAPITNRAAMTSAVVFYDRLISGWSVQEAHDASGAIISALHANEVEAALHPQAGVNPKTERFHEVPRIIARFDGSPRAYGGYFYVELGLMGCRHDTIQIVFITDDTIYSKPGSKQLERDLCLVVRDTPIRGVVWSDFEWGSYGDCTLYACATTSAGKSFTVASTFCKAIEAYACLIQSHTPENFPAPLQAALDRLRSEDGSGLSVKNQRAGKRAPGGKRTRPKNARRK